jgi:hypothetical protein|tara:strand:- start:3424 stop:3693 length:270 start_codon:yes stop_codon:yes gene_type:complete
MKYKYVPSPSAHKDLVSCRYVAAHGTNPLTDIHPTIRSPRSAYPPKQSATTTPSSVARSNRPPFREIFFTSSSASSTRPASAITRTSAF